MPFFCSCLHTGGFWHTEGLVMCFLQELHRLYVHLTCFYCKLDQFFCIKVHIREWCIERYLNKSIYLGVCISELSRMIQIGTYSFQCKYEIVLQSRYRGLFATYPFYCTPSPFCRLGALITKHFQFFHLFTPRNE